MWAGVCWWPKIVSTGAGHSRGADELSNLLACSCIQINVVDSYTSSANQFQV